jgi:hypothetical protein
MVIRELTCASSSNDQDWTVNYATGSAASGWFRPQPCDARRILVPKISVAWRSSWFPLCSAVSIGIAGEAGTI